MGEALGGVFLSTLQLIDIKCPEKITLCDANTVILLTTVIILDTWFLGFYLSQKKCFDNHAG